jgi:hypothetical protein
VPAYANPPASIASAETVPPSGRPLLISLHSEPSVVDRKAPPAAPTKTWPTEFTATAFMSCAVMPLFCSVHVSPLSVDRKTPPPRPNCECVPAKM